MYQPFADIGLAIVALLFCTWWWFIAKKAASKKYIVSLGVCWLVSSIGYIIGESFDIPALRGVLGGVIVLALLGSIYFFIRAALSERKAKKKAPDD